MNLKIKALDEDDIPLVVELLAEQRALKLRAANMTTKIIAGKFAVDHRVIYKVRTAYEKEIGEKARELAK